MCLQSSGSSANVWRQEWFYSFYRKQQTVWYFENLFISLLNQQKLKQSTIITAAKFTLKTKYYEVDRALMGQHHFLSSGVSVLRRWERKQCSTFPQHLPSAPSLSTFPQHLSSAPSLSCRHGRLRCWRTDDELSQVSLINSLWQPAYLKLHEVSCSV